MDFPVYIPFTMEQMNSSIVNAVREVLAQQHHSQNQLPAGQAGEELLTVAQTAQLLNVCRATVFEWRRHGILAAASVKLGGKRYFKRSLVLAAGKADTLLDGRREHPRRGASKGRSSGQGPKNR